VRVAAGVLRASPSALLVLLVVSGFALFTGRSSADDTSPYNYDGPGGFASLLVAHLPDGTSDRAHLLAMNEVNGDIGSYDHHSNLALANARSSDEGLAPNTARGAAGFADDGVTSSRRRGGPSSAPRRGAVYDVPEGWVGRTADNGRGIVGLPCSPA
jgi:hypothetical protein